MNTRATSRRAAAAALANLSCVWLLGLSLMAAPSASAAPVAVPKDEAVTLPRNDAGPGICAAVTHVATPMNGAPPFLRIDQVPPVANATKGAMVMGLTVDDKVARVFKDLNFRNAQPGAIGDFTGAGTDESYFPFSDTAEAMPRGNDRNFAVRSRGYLNVKKGTVVTVALHADDAASLIIGGVKVIETDERISARAATQVAFGGPGLYPVELTYFQNGTAGLLEVSEADSAETEGNLNELDTGKFKLWPSARLFTTRAGLGAACQECGPGIAEQCPMGQACVDGLCQSCQLPDNCGAGCMRCPAERRVCKAGTCAQCQSDLDCRGGKICEDATGNCVDGKGCAQDKDCPAGRICDPERRVCVTGGPCKADSECPAGTLCDPTRMRCVAFPCRADNDCPAEQVCNTDRQTCAPICASDKDCSTGQRCDSTLKRCVNSCQTDGDCPTGLLCDTTSSRCVPRCTTDLECSPAQRCDTARQRCAAFCRADSDCTKSQRCDLQKSLCVASAGKERYVGGCSQSGTTGAGPLWPGALLLLGLAGLLRRRPRVSRGMVGIAGLVFFSALTGSARAEISANALTFQPAIGPDNIITVEGSRTGARKQIFVNGVLEFSLRPLRLLDAEGNTLANTVNSITSLHVTGGLGITRWLAVGLHLPVALYQDFDRRTPATDVPGDKNPYPFGVGDLRLWGKARLIDNSESGFGVALAPQIMFPTGQNLRSGGSFDLELLRGVADYRFKGGTLIALNFSFLFRTSKQQVRDVLVGHQVRYGLGVYVPVRPTVGVMAEIAGGTSMERLPLVGNQTGPVYSALEGHLGARWRHQSGLTVMGGLGTGFTDAVGSPQLRIFAGVGYLPLGQSKATPVDPDPDHDGILGLDDLCPDVPGPVENRGCPEKDTDKDGIVDRSDRCPLVAGPPENHGCPDVDTDKDGLIDRLDRCPQVPGPKENEGCPEKDTDSDGIIDRLDRCPRDPGPAPEGCPKRQFIVVKEDKIDLLQKVYFATNKATINPGSYPLLDEVADLLKKRGSMEIRIEGHTDNTGPMELNLRLSRERAVAVRLYLIKAGVAAPRLFAEGFGPNKPVAENTTPAGRDKNRRTEFMILKQ